MLSVRMLNTLPEAVLSLPVTVAVVGTRVAKGR